MYDDWRSGTASDYYGTLYLLEFYQIVEQLGAHALVVTTLPGARASARREGVTIVNHPLPDGVSGAHYHAAMLVWAIRCVVTVGRFRANAAVLTAGQDYFWPFAVLRMLGTRLLVSLHCTLWPKFAQRKRHRRLLDWLNGRLLYPACDHIQANSDEGLSQVRQISRRLRSPLVRYVATYAPSRFTHAGKPALPGVGARFQLLYVGRIAENKGVIDAVHILRRLEERHPGEYALSMCGSGPDDRALAAAIENLGLHGVVSTHGECSAEQLHQFYADCHAVLIPTRSDFEEGQPKVAFEAVLNYRPVIMSAACPALQDVREATVEARVDDVEDYVRSIEHLSRDRAVYEEKVAGAESTQGKFLDRQKGYGHALSRALSDLTARRGR